MNRQLFSYAALMLLGVFISSVAQVMLKKAAEKQYDSVIGEYLNVRVITAYVIFSAAFFSITWATELMNTPSSISAA